MQTFDIVDKSISYKYITPINIENKKKRNSETRDNSYTQDVKVS